MALNSLSKNYSRDLCLRSTNHTLSTVTTTVQPTATTTNKVDRTWSVVVTNQWRVGAHLNHENAKAPEIQESKGLPLCIGSPRVVLEMSLRAYQCSRIWRHSRRRGRKRKWGQVMSSSMWSDQWVKSSKMPRPHKTFKSFAKKSKRPKRTSLRSWQKTKINLTSIWLDRLSKLNVLFKKVNENHAQEKCL